jgi:hypothetical protein
LKQSFAFAVVSELETSMLFKLTFPVQLRSEVSIFFERKFNKVVFPAPEPPIIAKASPVFTLPDAEESKVFVFCEVDFLKHLPAFGMVEIVMFSHFSSKLFLKGFWDFVK